MIDWYTVLGDKHYEILKRILMYPPLSDMLWRDVLDLLEKLKERLGGEVTPTFGGRTRIMLDSGDRGEIHQPESKIMALETNVRELKRLMESARIRL
jgi:hypothetical protein